MEFNEGLQILKKMCRGRIACNGCPLKNVACPKLESAAPSLWDDNQIIFVSETVEDWNKKHKPKTMLEIVKERFPDVKWSLGNNTPDFCPYLLFGKFGYEGVVCSKTKCHECWSRIAPDEYQNGGK